MTLTIVNALEALVGPHGVLTGGDMASYEVGARYGSGRAACVVRPATTAEVSCVVAFCAAQGIRIVLQGANTGLVGAGSPDDTGTQVVPSLSRLSKVFAADAANRSVTAAASMLLQDLNERLEPMGCGFPSTWAPIRRLAAWSPPTPAARGSSAMAT